jgi:four helix bundle protein
LARRTAVKSYQDLLVWQHAFSLCAAVYRHTRKLPASELYGLTGQLRRAAVSIPANIAEGYGRRTTADFLRSLYIAYGSICELETHILLAGKLGFLDSGRVNELLQSLGDVDRLCKALMRALERKRSST